MQHLARRGLLAGLAAGAVCGPARAAITGLVAVGREGWLFPIWDEVRSVDLKRVAQVGAVCGAAAELLTKANIQVVFALTPVKSRVYRAFLPDDFSFGADPERRYATAIETLQRIAFAPDLLAPIVAERDANKTEPAFFKGDTHWTAAGAQATAAELARQIDIHYQAPPSAQSGMALAAATTLTWEKNDLAELLPAPQNASYPLEDYRIRQLIVAHGADALLDDVAADVVVVGNSFMQPRLGFVPMLSNKLNRPVSLYWKIHQIGPYQTLLNYLATDGFRRRRPALIVWNFHETDMTLMPDRRDGWGQNAIAARFAGRIPGVNDEHYSSASAYPPRCACRRHGGGGGTWP
jgi:alginate O-acetyltransferase complex protein AlgJ